MKSLTRKFPLDNSSFSESSAILLGSIARRNGTRERGEQDAATRAASPTSPPTEAAAAKVARLLVFSNY